MEEYKCTIEQDVKVKFNDPEKAKEVYLGDAWKNTFFDYEDLDEVARHLAFAMDEESGHWNPDKKRAEQFVEGFGDFVWKGGGKFELTGLAAVADGGITVTFDDREITDTEKTTI